MHSNPFTTTTISSSSHTLYHPPHNTATVIPLIPPSKERRELAIRAQFEHHRKRRSLTEEDFRDYPEQLGNWRSLGSVDLKNCHQVLYSGIIGLGTPVQYFNVDFDTGSSDLWVVSELCDTSCDEYNLTRYDPFASSTFVWMEESFEVEYADGELMEGKHARETLNWAGYEVTDQIFAQVTHLNDYSMCVEEDGIFGLAFSSISSHNFTSPVKNAVDKNVLPHNVFSLYLDETDDYDEEDQLIEGEDHILSRLIVGGIDPNLYDGCITDNWHDVAKGTFNGTSELHGLWDVNLDSIHLEVNNEKTYTFALSEEDAFLTFDSGSTNLIGPFEAISSYAVEANAKCFSFATDFIGEPIMEEEECQPDFFWFDGWDIAQVDCNASLPDLIFTTEKSEIRFTRDDLVIEFFDEDEGESNCYLKLQGSPGFFPGWVLGDVFMQSYYTLFDRDTERVAFAPSLPRGSSRTEDVCEGDINIDINEDVEEDKADPSAAPVISINVDIDDLETVPVPVPAPVISISGDTEVPTAAPGPFVVSTPAESNTSHLSCSFTVELVYVGLIVLLFM